MKRTRLLECVHQSIIYQAKIKLFSSQLITQVTWSYIVFGKLNHLSAEFMDSLKYKYPSSSMHNNFQLEKSLDQIHLFQFSITLLSLATHVNYCSSIMIEIYGCQVALIPVYKKNRRNLSVAWKHLISTLFYSKDILKCWMFLSIN